MWRCGRCGPGTGVWRRRSHETNKQLLPLFGQSRQALSHRPTVCGVDYTQQLCAMVLQAASDYMFKNKITNRFCFILFCVVLYLFRSWLPQGHVKLYAQC